MTARGFLVLAAGLALTSCSGGSAANRYQSLYDDYNLMRINRLGLPATRTMPTTGTATYTGAAGYLFGGETTASTISALTLNANFATGGVSGAMKGFVSNDGSEYPGDLTIAGGPMTGNGFARPVSGALKVDGDVRAISGTIYGQFYGRSAEAVEVVGNLTAAGTATPVTVFGLADR